MQERTIAYVRCKRPGCKKEAVALGLCRSDYAAMHRLVQEGVITREELERKGKIDPRRPSAKSWFLGN